MIFFAKDVSKIYGDIFLLYKYIKKCLTMASLLEHVMLNNLSNEIKNAIEDIGGDTTCISGPQDFPDHIRNNLNAGPIQVVEGQIAAGNGVELDRNSIPGTTKISANSNAFTVDDLAREYYEGQIPSKTTIQNVFEIIFDKILPYYPSILQGDIIESDVNGKNEFQHPLGSKFGTGYGVVTELHPKEPYLRLFMNDRKIPLYISLQPIITASNVERIEENTIDNIVDNVTK